jgi:DNA-binding NarL/FixJ family response regulator
MAKAKRKGLVAVREALRSDVASGSGENGLADTPIPDLSPRMRQTLDRLLAGDSEKQIAGRLGVSKNTVHVYVKALYRTFNVCSRGELLARFIRAS